MIHLSRFLVFILPILFVTTTMAEKVAVLEEMNKPETIQFDSGNIYILEGVTVFIYDETTYRFKGKFGKEGEGPGEIKKNPYGGPLIVNPYRGKVTISSMGKYSIFSKDGNFEKEIKISPYDNFYPFEDKFICMSVYIKNQAEMYLAVYMAEKDFKKAKEPLVVTDTMVGQNFMLRFPFTSFAPWPYKNKIYVAPYADKFIIDIYNMNAKKIKTISRDYQTKKITPQYRQKTREWFKKDPNWRNAYEMFRSRINFRDKYPPIFALWVDNDKIHVITYDYDKNGDRLCIIMDLEGKELKRIYLPMKENYGMDFTFPYCFHKDNFFIIKENFENETWELHRQKF